LTNTNTNNQLQYRTPEKQKRPRTEGQQDRWTLSQRYDDSPALWSAVKDMLTEVEQTVSLLEQVNHADSTRHQAAVGPQDGNHELVATFSNTESLRQTNMLSNNVMLGQETCTLGTQLTSDGIQHLDNQLSYTTPDAGNIWPSHCHYSCNGSYHSQSWNGQQFVAMGSYVDSINTSSLPNTTWGDRSQPSQYSNCYRPWTNTHETNLPRRSIFKQVTEPSHNRSQSVSTDGSLIASTSSTVLPQSSPSKTSWLKRLTAKCVFVDAYKGELQVKQFLDPIMETLETITCDDCLTESLKAEIIGWLATLSSTFTSPESRRDALDAMRTKARRSLEACASFNTKRKDLTKSASSTLRRKYQPLLTGFETYLTNSVPNLAKNELSNALKSIYCIVGLLATEDNTEIETFENFLIKRCEWMANFTSTTVEDKAWEDKKKQQLYCCYRYLARARDLISPYKLKTTVLLPMATVLHFANVTITYGGRNASFADAMTKIYHHYFDIDDD
jgi:hypothetical protein